MHQCPKCRNLSTEVLYRNPETRKLTLFCRSCGHRWVVVEGGKR